MAKPFIKWAGGKGQLISQIEAYLPQEFDNLKDITYIEPFVGGGALLFHMLLLSFGGYGYVFPCASR